MNPTRFTLIATLALFSVAAPAQDPPNARPRVPEPGEIPPPREPRVPKPPEAPSPDRGPDGERKRGGGGGGVVDTEHLFDALSPLRDMFGRSPRPLVISSSAVSAEVVAEIEEDSEVMARILEKALARSSGQGQDQRYMGITIPGFSGNRSGQNLYLDGYGALFILNVRFPLTPDSGKPSDKREDRSNSTWEQTRREVQGEPPPPMDGRGMKYSEEKVQSLKKELISELRNATNLRGLKPEESITIVVVGDDGANEFGLRRVPARSKTALAKRYDPAGGESERPPRSTTLTLRVKKSEVDAFAKDKMDFESFQKKVAVATY